jgi:hypothetical protein
MIIVIDKLYIKYFEGIKSRILPQGIIIPEGKFLIEKNNEPGLRSKEYKNCYRITFKGMLFCYYYSNAYDKNNIGTVGIKVVNEWLYKSEWYSLLQQFSNQLGLQEKYICSLDLALDTREDLIQKFEQYYHNEEKYFLTHRKDYSIALKGVKRNGEVQSIVYKHFVIYNKTEEIKAGQKKEFNYKQYIQDFHNKNIGKGPIYRFEIRLNRKLIQSKKVAVTLKDLTDQSFLLSYFKKNMLLIKVRTSTRSERMKSMDFIDFSKMNLAYTFNPIDRHYKTDNIYHRKAYIKSVYLRGRQVYSVTLINEAAQVAGEIGLSEWFDKKKKKWDNEFEHSNPKKINTSVSILRNIGNDIVSNVLHYLLKIA